MADTVASSGTQSPRSQSPASQQTTEDLFASDEFRMFAYKILPCPKKTQHEWSTCPYSHPNEKARRRDPRIYSYLAIPCEATKQGGTCPRGDECPNCHSLFEYWLHPSRYRTQLCRDMENGVCKRQVCFFAHSIEELRVPDHSHLNIPPEMQAAAAANSANSSASTSPDTTAANSSSGSGSSTPRASSKDSTSSSKAAASKLPSGGKSLERISNSSRGSSGKSSRSSSNNSPVGQWPGHASTPAGAAAAVLGNTNGLGRYYAAMEQQRALMQLQMQAQGLAPASSLYEQQVQQMLRAAEYAQAQQQAQQQQAAQLLMLQSQQAAAAAWGTHLAQNSMGGGMYADTANFKGGSPPLSPLPGSLVEGCSPPYAGENRHFFVPPSASSASSSAMSSGWQSASLLRTLSTPADTTNLGSSLGTGGLGTGGLIRHASFAAVGGPTASHTTPHFASTGGVQLQHNSGASSLADSPQDLTLASLLSGRSGSGNWGSAGGMGMPAASVGLGSSGSGAFGSSAFGGQGLGQQLGMGQQGLGSSGAGLARMGSGLGSGDASMDMANLLLLQQQLQQKAAYNNALDLLQQASNGGQANECNNQAMGDMLGLMMQQLMLQQQSTVV